MLANVERVIIAYGSESGNAQRLAHQLSEFTFTTSVHHEVVELNKLQLASLTAKDLLLIISSTFGDGEPPENAEDFAEHLKQSPQVSTFKFAVFGLGDVAYTHFCQQGKLLDQYLHDKGATRIINRVDADINYRGFFELWTKTLQAVLDGDNNIGHQLQLQVIPYDETAPHKATITEVQRLNSSESGVYNIELDISDSGMGYRAGDLLYVMPPQQTSLLSALATWLDDVNAIEELDGKELRLMTKSILRSLVRKSKNNVGIEKLKNKLKSRNKSALEDYLYGRDILDILQDCGNPGFISLNELSNVLKVQIPRAYSISSSPAPSLDTHKPTHVSLCVRDVAYTLNERSHTGTCSHFLSHCKTGDTADVFVRSNAEFHLEDDIDTPIIMIGAGTGIAPYIGFLKQLEDQNKNIDSILFFGERFSDHDLLYKPLLNKWLDNGTLTELVTAFSRDQDEKHYVQHALLDHGKKIWELLESKAMIYVCGNKNNLSKPIDLVLIKIVEKHGNQSREQAEHFVAQLSECERYRRDLY